MSEAMPQMEEGILYSRETAQEEAMFKVLDWLGEKVSGGINASAQERVTALTEITDEIDESPKKYNIAIADVASLLRRQAELEADYDSKMSQLSRLAGESR